MEKCLTITSSVKQENLVSHKSQGNMEEVKVTDFLSVEVEENVTKVMDTDVDSGDDGNSTHTDFENEANEEDIPKAGDTDNESVDKNVSDVNERRVGGVEHRGDGLIGVNADGVAAGAPHYVVVEYQGQLGVDILLLDW